MYCFAAAFATNYICASILQMHSLYKFLVQSSRMQYVTYCVKKRRHGNFQIMTMNYAWKSEKLSYIHAIQTVYLGDIFETTRSKIRRTDDHTELYQYSY